MVPASAVESSCLHPRSCCKRAGRCYDPNNSGETPEIAALQRKMSGEFLLTKNRQETDCTREDYKVMLTNTRFELPACSMAATVSG
jgi:hypothetical protein